jgi:hypothetical protein
MKTKKRDLSNMNKQQKHTTTRNLSDDTQQTQQQKSAGEIPPFIYNSSEMRRYHTLSNRHKYPKKRR